MRSLLTSAFLLSAIIARAQPEFVGVLSSKESGTQFAVVETPSSPPTWIKLGDSIGSYIVSEHRIADEVLIFKKDGREFPAKLKESRVQHADYRGEELSVAAAKQLIASDPSWQSDVIYTVFRRKDGGSSLSAAKRDGNGYRVRFLPLTPESVLADKRENK